MTDTTETPAGSRTADQQLRIWAIEQAVEYTKGRDGDGGWPTRLAAIFVRYVTDGEVKR